MKNIYNLSDLKVSAKYDTSGEDVITKFEFYDYLNKRSQEEEYYICLERITICLSICISSKV